MNKKNIKMVLKSNEINNLILEVEEHIKSIEVISKHVEDISSIMNNKLKVGDKNRYQRLYFKLINDIKLQHQRIDIKKHKIEVLMVEIKILGEI